MHEVGAAVGELREHIPGAVNKIHIIPGTAHQRVRAVTAIQGVIAGIARQAIGKCAAFQAFYTDQSVDAVRTTGAAIEQADCHGTIGPAVICPIHIIRAIAANQAVIAQAANQGVMASTSR